MVALGAAFVQGMLGFGFTLVAISFFLILVGQQAIHLVIVINLGITFLLAVPLWRHVPLRLWLYLVGGALMGLPFGMLAYGAANTTHLQIAAGIVVVTFGCLAWFDVSFVPLALKRDPLRTKAWPLAVGIVAGFFATSLGMPGPLLILFLAGLDLEKDVIRGTAITFLAVANAAALVFHAVVFSIELSVVITASVLLPIAAIGSWGGHVVSHRLGRNSFRHALLALVTASGVYAVYSSFA